MAKSVGLHSCGGCQWAGTTDSLDTKSGTSVFCRKNQRHVVGLQWIQGKPNFEWAPLEVRSSGPKLCSCFCALCEKSVAFSFSSPYPFIYFTVVSRIPVCFKTSWCPKTPALLQHFLRFGNNASVSVCVTPCVQKGRDRLRECSPRLDFQSFSHQTKVFEIV